MKRNAHWLLFVLLEGASLACLFAFNARQRGQWFAMASTFRGWVSAAHGQLSYYADLREENRLLTLRNVTLQKNLNSTRWELEQLRRTPSPTRQNMDARLSECELIAARVVNNTVRQRDNMLLINRGSDDGVRPEQGVVSGTGIVGVVSQVGRRYASVVPVLHRRSSISCRIRGSRYFGYLHWTGGSPLRAVLDDVPHHARVQVGDEVETSGFSNIFPEGLFVGRITDIAYSADGQAYRLGVQLGNDLAHVHEVMVVVNPDRADMEDAGL